MMDAQCPRTLVKLYRGDAEENDLGHRGKRRGDALTYSAFSKLPGLPKLRKGFQTLVEPSFRHCVAETRIAPPMTLQISIFLSRSPKFWVLGDPPSPPGRLRCP